jgi:signal transduction histidine kinase
MQSALRSLRRLPARHLPEAAGGIGLTMAALAAWALHPDGAWQSWLVLGLGSLAALLLAVLLAAQRLAREGVEAELRQSVRVLRGAIDALEEAFVLYDADDRLVLCNQKYLDTYRSSAEAIVPGARFEDILRHGLRKGQYPAARGCEEAWLAERLAQHRSGGATVLQRLDDGRTVRVIERRTTDGHLVGFRVDVTELLLATEAAERADRTKSEFIATISHELRTPLQSVIGFSELGRHFAADHLQFGPMFDDILSGGRRMLKLVNALLDVSKIDARGTALNTAPGDLGALAVAVVRELQPQIAARSLRVQLPQPLPALPVRVDAFRMQQVLRNVLANAIRFTPAGSAVELACGVQPGAGVWLSVRDHGPGIPADELQSVFEPFVQSSRTRDGAGGTGLGLTICRKIMLAHSGRIEAANAEGGGALMTLWLPAMPVPPGPSAAVPVKRPGPEAQSASTAVPA